MNDLANEINKIEQWIAPLIKKASISDRRKLARRIGTQLLSSQSNRIRNQKNLDGTPYLSRKDSTNNKRMFEKIRKRPNLKMHSNQNAVEVGFTGRASKIAEVHQYGLTDTANPRGKKIRYSRRELLGFTQQDIENINDLLVKYLTAE